MKNKERNIIKSKILKCLINLYVIMDAVAKGLRMAKYGILGKRRKVKEHQESVNWESLEGKGLDNKLTKWE